jgi:hypothetical protein
VGKRCVRIEPEQKKIGFLSRKIYLHGRKKAHQLVDAQYNIVKSHTQGNSPQPFRMAIVRKITMSCLKNNILIKASHVPGVKNVTCDALSRFQLQKFKVLAPHADQEPQQVPPSLWQIFEGV